MQLFGNSDASGVTACRGTLIPVEEWVTGGGLAETPSSIDITKPRPFGC